MTLIADSGSTKTDWCLIRKGKENIEFQTIGMNPYTISPSEITNEIRNRILPQIKNENISNIHFYGAGCSSPEKKDFMKEMFSAHFPNTKIEINHDLMGACKALCQNEKGIVGILGTGSNSCLYDGCEIVENVPSLGYILCDEGSGSMIGKVLLKLYLRDEFPQELHQAFKENYPGKENDFLDKIYKSSLPNRFLASFTPFAYEHRTHPFIETLLTKVFQEYFESQIIKYSDYQKYKLSIIGSVAYYFQEIISEIAQQYGVAIGCILKVPLSGLIDYHTK